jgi:hypothetical protein
MDNEIQPDSGVGIQSNTSSSLLITFHSEAMAAKMVSSSSSLGSTNSSIASQSLFEELSSQVVLWK